MEQNFETSFIPKKPTVEKKEKVKRPTGLLTVGAVLIFVTVILGSVGLYLYKQNLEKTLIQKAEDIRLAESRFEPKRITQLEILGRRLSASKEVLSEHIATSPIFSELSKLTRKQVRYTDFTYQFSEEHQKAPCVRLVSYPLH